MIILLRKQTVCISLLFCCFLVGFVLLMWAGHLRVAAPVFSVQDGRPITVVIDPGHGGEDGGAVSPDGVAESGINLAVSLRTNDLLRFAGIRTMMTRTEDVSISDSGLSTMRQRKVSDIHNRVALVNGTPNAVLISIHQNSLPTSRITHGAQVFWNTQEGAQELARVMQDSLNGDINAGNEKQPKQIPDSIYLMKNSQVPAVLVECGFLSNSEETLRLQQPNYQTKLASCIVIGYLRRLAGEEIS